MLFRELPRISKDSTGDKAQAIAAYEKALPHDPKFQSALKVLAELKKLAAKAIGFPRVKALQP